MVPTRLGPYISYQCVSLCLPMICRVLFNEKQNKIVCLLSRLHRSLSEGLIKYTGLSRKINSLKVIDVETSRRSRSNLSKDINPECIKTKKGKSQGTP